LLQILRLKLAPKSFEHENFEMAISQKWLMIECVTFDDINLIFLQCICQATISRVTGSDKIFQHGVT